jgi:protein TonB
MTVPNNWRPGVRAPVVFDPAMLDQQPSPGFQAKPVYPFEMKQEGLSGSVLVDFIVDSEGNVRNAAAVRSTNPEFASIGGLGCQQVEIQAGQEGGHAVSTHMQVPIEFTLDNSEQ